MVETDKFLVTNIRQYLNSDNPKLGEDKLIQELSEFSCPKNSDIEHFLKKSAIEFTKKNQSVTYLVFSLKSMALVGYFTIALKPLTVRGEKVSNTIKRKIMRVAEIRKLRAQSFSNWLGTLLRICNIWGAEWWCFWRQMTKKAC